MQYSSNINITLIMILSIALSSVRRSNKSILVSAFTTYTLKKNNRISSLSFFRSSSTTKANVLFSTTEEQQEETSTTKEEEHGVIKNQKACQKITIRKLLKMMHASGGKTQIVLYHKRKNSSK